MQFAVIGQWLLDGCSPHTGLPVVETCRIVKPGHYWDVDARAVFGEQQVHPIYRAGQTYAIQLGRGKPAMGRTSPLVGITRQDVRQMTQADAVRRGFASPIFYWQAWCEMHDPRAVELMTDKWFTEATIPHYDETAQAVELLRPVLLARPAERYAAWTLRFEGRNVV